MTDKEIYERQEDVISNLNIFGLTDSMWASGYPMSTEIGDLDEPSQSLTYYCLYRDDKDSQDKTIQNAAARAERLGRSPLGSGHDNYLNGCVAQFDLTFTIKAWTEAERYHFFDFVSSQSTMHRLQKMDVSKSCIEYVDGRVIDAKQVEELAKTPSKEVLLGRLLGSLQGPLYSLARVLTAVTEKDGGAEAAAE